MTPGVRLAGIALFLPVPVVLWLFVRGPLGVIPSVLVGVVLMVTHRWYARPFALRYAAARCLWCGGRARAPIRLEINEPMGRYAWTACGGRHAERLAAVLHWSARHARAVRLGVLGTLAAFLVILLLSARGWAGDLVPADATALFRLGVAITVLPLGWLGTRRGPRSDTPPRVPFPAHIQALIGTWAVIWLFRVIGMVWLAQGAWYLWMRLGGAK